MIRTVAVAVLAFAASGTAHADWQYTRWGMTPTDVLKASKGATRIVVEVKPAPGIDYPGLKGRHQKDETAYETRFFFSENQLARIEMLPAERTPQAAGRVETRLRERYGDPVSEKSSAEGRVLVWRDEPRNNRIILQLNDGDESDEAVPLLSLTALTAEEG